MGMGADHVTDLVGHEDHFVKALFLYYERHRAPLPLAERDMLLNALKAISARRGRGAQGAERQDARRAHVQAALERRLEPGLVDSSSGLPRAAHRVITLEDGLQWTEHRCG